MLLLGATMVDATEHPAGWHYYLINSRPHKLRGVLRVVDHRAGNIV